MVSIYEILGQKIRAERLSRGLTLETLGDLAQLHPAQIGQIERNQKKASLATIARLADALQIGLALLFKESRPAAPLTPVRRLNSILRPHSPANQKSLLRIFRLIAREFKGSR